MSQHDDRLFRFNMWVWQPFTYVVPPFLNWWPLEEYLLRTPHLETSEITTTFNCDECHSYHCLIFNCLQLNLSEKPNEQTFYQSAETSSTGKENTQSNRQQLLARGFCCLLSPQVQEVSTQVKTVTSNWFPSVR